MADNSNQSPLFGDMMDTPKPSAPGTSATPTPPIESTVPPQTADTFASILGGAAATPIPSVGTSEKISSPEPVKEVSPPPTPLTPEAPLPTSADSMAAILGSLATTPPPTLPTSEIKNDSPIKPLEVAPKVDEPSSKVAEVVPTSPEEKSSVKKSPDTSKADDVTVDPRLQHYLEEDVIYNSMLRIIDAERIRLKLAIRYMILMFAIFLVIVWIVNNRIIMFGFSEFQWLARIRDSLFGVIAGLFSLTIWFGSEVWFHKWIIIWFFRILSLVFFAAVLSALYFPLW